MSAAAAAMILGRASRVRGATIAAAAAIAVCFAAITPAAHGALPPDYGGRLKLAAPSGAALSIDPIAVRDPFGAALAAAVFDTLYEIDGQGAVRPVLAADLPVRTGATAVVALREGLRRHDGRPLRAIDVERSLVRASTSPRAAWLLASLGSHPNGNPDVRAIDETHLQLQLANERFDVARVLAAAPLAIAVATAGGRSLAGTGAFAAQPAIGELRLVTFPRAAEGAARLDILRVLAPRSREDELRAFELGTLDASWRGRSLYGGAPARPVAVTSLVSSCPVLLVPNRASAALRDAGVWGAVAAAVDRRRLERVGLAADATLGLGLRPAAPPSARRPSARTRLRLPVASDDAFSAQLAEALAGSLDEAGFSLEVQALAPDRYAAAIASGGWELRIETVLPPLPGAGALALAALAASGHASDARAMFDPDALRSARVAAAAARRIDAIVLGRRRDTLTHRADLRGARFDALGRLVLAELFFERRAQR